MEGEGCDGGDVGGESHVGLCDDVVFALQGCIQLVGVGEGEGFPEFDAVELAV